MKYCSICDSPLSDGGQVYQLSKEAEREYVCAACTQRLRRIRACAKEGAAEYTQEINDLAAVADGNCSAFAEGYLRRFIKASTGTWREAIEKQKQARAIQLEAVFDEPEDQQPEQNQQAEEAASPADARQGLFRRFSCIPVWVKGAIGGLVLVCMVAVGAVFLFHRFSAKTSKTPIAAANMTDGGAVFAVPNGATLNIRAKGDAKVERAVMTGDGKNAVTLYDSGYLTVADSQKGTWLESFHAASFMNYHHGLGYYETNSFDEHFRNDGFFFFDEEEQRLSRITFDGRQRLRLDKGIVEIKVSDTSTSCIYTRGSWEDGYSVYALPAGETEPKRLSYGQAGGDVVLIGVSDGGNIAAWIDTGRDDLEGTLYITENGKKEKVLSGITGLNSNSCSIVFSKDQKLAAIRMNFDGRWALIIKKRGKEAQRAVGSGKVINYSGIGLYPNPIYTEKGNFTELNANQINSLYLLVSETSQNIGKLYCVSMDGDKERILSDVNNFSVANGRMVYVTSRNELYAAEIKNASLVNESFVSQDVSPVPALNSIAYDIYTSFLVPGRELPGLITKDGAYCYYTVDEGNSWGLLEMVDLYCYSFKTGKSEKVASDINATRVNEGESIPFFQYGAKSDTVFLWKDVDNNGVGTLYVWQRGDKAPTRLATGTAIYSLSSGRRDGLIDEDGFIYFKQDETDLSSEAYDIVWSNGKTHKKLVSQWESDGLL